ncbi:MAG: Gfo/Idh/MocA family oxidoreductase [Planctomycetes bacterium]|nr:Gfo/Idh/MocA family oxidoreductase [Planctomycetota bacterium]
MTRPRDTDRRDTGRRITRRQALKLAAAAGGALAAPLLVRPAALGLGGAVAPSERITLGFIGIGRMGQGHLRCFLGYPEAQVVAVCDVDRWRRQDAKEAVERTYTQASAAQGASGGAYAGCAAYADLRELVARGDIDAAVVVTGDRWHAQASVLAAKAGKDVYCEKPMTLTIREGRAMTDVVRRYGRVFQTGLQQRSTPEFQRASELVRSGRIGRVKVVYVGFPGTCGDVNLPPEPVPESLDWDLWLGPAPWRPFNNRFHQLGPPRDVVPWHFCPDFGGGNLTSNAVHAFDVVQWGLGMDESGPVEVIPPETGEVPCLTYRYASGTLLQVTWKLEQGKHLVPAGWDPSTTIQNFGALYVGEEGWIHVGREGYLRSHPEAIVGRGEGEAGGGRPVPSHHHNWLECIRSRARTACDVAVGHRSTTVSHLGCIAHWTGRALQWDPVQEEFPGDDEANRLRSRAYREPWGI